MQRIWQLIEDRGLKAIPILKLRESLLQESRLTQNYLVLTGTSCAIATLGLLANSAAVIIGAMIIAPLMLPLRGFAFAALEGDRELMQASTRSVGLGTGLAVLCSWLVGLVVGIPEFGSEVLSRTQPTLLDLTIAVMAGVVSGYAKVRPAVGDALPGTAIAVALMPPLCVIGLTLSQGDWASASGAMLLYATNLVGINVACLGVYVISGYTRNNELNRTLSWSVSAVVMMLLAIPLGISFWQLVSQARANESLQSILASNALANRRDVEILHSEVDWRTKPPAIFLTVRSELPITPAEVSTVEQLLQDELKQTFKVTFEVTPSETVRSGS